MAESGARNCTEVAESRYSFTDLTRQDLEITRDPVVTCPL
jgi:hypothetical protein